MPIKHVVYVAWKAVKYTALFAAYIIEGLLGF